MNKNTILDPKTKAVGRPTKFTPAVYNQIEKYISQHNRENTSLPTIEGLALYLSLSKETLYQWAKENDEFSDAIKKILMKQKVQLMDDGMYGGKEVNPAMAIFLLKVNHGMKENDPTTLIKIVMPILGKDTITE